MPYQLFGDRSDEEVITEIYADIGHDILSWLGSTSSEDLAMLNFKSSDRLVTTLIYLLVWRAEE